MKTEGKNIHELSLTFRKALSGASDPISKIDLIINYCRNNNGLLTSPGPLIPLVYEGVKLAQKENYKCGEVALQAYVAFVLWYDNKYNDATNLLQLYKQQMIAYELYFEYGIAQLIISLILWSKGELENAFETVYEGFDAVKRKKGNHYAIARLNIILGVFYYDLNELDLSFKYYIIAQKKFQKFASINDYGLMNYILIGLASVYKSQKKYKKSKELFETSLRISKKYDLWVTIARTTYELGCLEMLMENNSEAIRLILKSYQIRSEFKSKPSMVTCLYSLGEIYFKTKRLDLAKEKLLFAFEICDEEGLVPKQALICLLLARIYSSEKNFEEAYMYHEKHHQLNTEINSLVTDNKTKYLKYKFKTKKAEEEKEYQIRINDQLQEANEIITKQKNDIIDKNRDILIKNTEKDMLLKEIHHRVKNNLQIITSLLSLQSLGIEDKDTKDLFLCSQHRINSMALIHEMLYQSENISKINYGDYIKELFNRLVTISLGKNHNVEISIETPVLYLNVDTAIPLGLLINEIITNALKYGISGNSGSIFLKITPLDNPNYQLEIGDDGCGFSDEINMYTTNSLGLKLIDKLAKQLNGEIKKDNTKKGTNYILTFQEVQHFMI